MFSRKYSKTRRLSDTTLTGANTASTLDHTIFFAMKSYHLQSQCYILAVDEIKKKNKKKIQCGQETKVVVSVMALRFGRYTVFNRNTFLLVSEMVQEQN